MSREQHHSMTIFVNLSNIHIADSPTGIGQYALNLLEGFRQIGRLSSLHFLVDSQDEMVYRRLFPEVVMTVVPALIPTGMVFRRGNVPSWRLELMRLFLKDRLGIPWLLRKEKEGILFHPFNALSVHVSSRMPTVITVHDLFYRNHPQVHSRKMRMLLDRCYRSIIYKPRQLIVPSAFVKSDIKKHFRQVDMERIRVIPNPVMVRECNQQPVAVPEPYLLSVNSLQDHKNLKTLILAFAHIEKAVPHHLVLVGRGNQRDEDSLTELIQRHGINKIVRTGYVNEAQRNYLYQHASLFISPSRHEGFGLTPIEAAFFRVPVLVTRETSLPEATRGLAVYYEPADDEQALARKIREVLKTPPSVEELDNIRTTYQQCYNPQIIAREYDRLFQNLLHPR